MKKTIDTKTIEIFSSRLKSARKAENRRQQISSGVSINFMTQAKTAQMVGISKEGYCRLEKGSQNPSVHTLIMLCRVLHVSADYLLGLSEVMSSTDDPLYKEKLKDAELSYSKLELMQEELVTGFYDDLNQAFRKISKRISESIKNAITDVDPALVENYFDDNGYIRSKRERY